MRKPWRIAATAITATALAVSLAGCASNNEKSGFTPKLDTKAQEQLDIVGYFGNFEALDQVVADFNKTYPNVTVNYQQVGSKDEEKYLEANGGHRYLHDFRRYACPWCYLRLRALRRPERARHRHKRY